MNLFEKLGMQAVAKLTTLNRKKQILAIHHHAEGTCLILADASRLVLDGLSEEDSSRIVGWLGFNGSGPAGIGTPAFAPWATPEDVQTNRS
jgi:hypothetical protein